MDSCIGCRDVGSGLHVVHHNDVFKWSVSRIDFLSAVDRGCGFCKSINRYFQAEDLSMEDLGFSCRVDKNAIRDPEFEQIHIELESRPGIWVFYVTVYPGLTLHGVFKASAHSFADDPAATDFSTRPSGLDIDSKAAFTAASRWLKECDSSYDGCNIAKACTLPKRVIDVGTLDGTEKPRLCNTQGEYGRYVALSYCWGGPQPVTTTFGTLLQNEQGIALEALPKTLRDAIVVTRRIGLQSIWIDALCIIQDSDEDKAEQIGRMDEIYENAYVTIAAGGATKCTEGFLRETRLSELLDVICIPYRCLDGRDGSLCLTASAGYGDDGEAISKRAWTFQELVLSKRLLFYGARLQYECPNNNNIYGFVHSRDEFEDHWTRRLLRRFAASSSIDPSQDDGSKKRRRLKFMWSKLIISFSMRGLTDPNDKLPAIAGVASRFQRLTGETYAAGLWKEHLPFALAWRATTESTEYRAQPTRRPSSWRAPSWSWASVDGPLTIENASCTGDPRCHVLTCETEPLYPAAPLGQLKSATMTLWAPCYEFSMSLLLNSPVQFMGTLDALPDVVERVVQAVTHTNEHSYFWVKEAGKEMTAVLDSPEDLDQPDFRVCSYGRKHTTVLCVVLYCQEDNVWCVGLVLKKAEGGHYKRIGLCFNFELEGVNYEERSVSII